MRKIRGFHVVSMSSDNKLSKYNIEFDFKFFGYDESFSMKEIIIARVRFLLNLEC